MGIIDKIFGAINGAPKGMPLSLQNDIEIAANTLSKTYKSCNNNYLETFIQAYVNIMNNISMRIAEGKCDPVIYEGIAYIIRKGAIRNFTDMALFNLYVTVIPPQIDLNNFFGICGEYVAKKLKFHGLPQYYILGDHSHITKEFLEANN